MTYAFAIAPLSRNCHSNPLALLALYAMGSGP
jgi:hypothetical protein